MDHSSKCRDNVDEEEYMRSFYHTAYGRYSACQRKTNTLLSTSHMHRDYVHFYELSRLEELVNMINSHMHHYSKHELFEDSITPKQEENL
ncbi:unnamed protein product [Rotaria sp. Silwood1]|nr:unnamed protein product [Rotaria sp. Silwood1]CAF5066602.1 unnamed protein product [Rotaria sp. Silwood1]